MSRATKRRMGWGENTLQIREVVDGVRSGVRITSGGLSSITGLSPSAVAIVMHRKAKEWGLKKVSRGLWKRRVKK